MGRKAEATPSKKCRRCSKKMERQRFSGRLEDLGVFRRRVFCNRECMTIWMEGRIKNPTAKNSRRQSAKRVESACEMCARMHTRLYVHHKNRNPLDNDPRNLQTLCGRCHRRCHSPNFTETGEQRRPCEFCKRPSFKRGWCATHVTRFRQFGHPLAKKRKLGSKWILMLHDGFSWSPFHLLSTRLPGSAASKPTVTPSSRSKRPSSSER